MTPQQKILVLEAAVCLNEDNLNLPEDVRNDLSRVAGWIDRQMDKDYATRPFDQFLTDQLKAVRLLCSNPQLFGGEHTND